MDFGPISQVTLASLLAGRSDSEKIFRGLNLLKKKKGGLTEVRLSASQAPFLRHNIAFVSSLSIMKMSKIEILLDDQAG